MDWIPFPYNFSFDSDNTAGWCAHCNARARASFSAIVSLILATSLRTSAVANSQGSLIRRCTSSQMASLLRAPFRALRSRFEVESLRIVEITSRKCFFCPSVPASTASRRCLFLTPAPFNSSCIFDALSAENFIFGGTEQLTAPRSSGVAKGSE